MLAANPLSVVGHEELVTGLESGTATGEEGGAGIAFDMDLPQQLLRVTADRAIGEAIDDALVDDGDGQRAKTSSVCSHIRRRPARC